MDVVVVTGSSDRQWRRKGSSGHVVAQLLESPLPTPRRSCCGRSADASPQRGHVPFKWESSPGVPKSAAAAAGGKAERDVPLPKPPPGRCGTCHAARAYHHHHHSNTTDSSSDQQDDDTFSDALDRISSSDRLAALSARLSAIDGAVFGSRRSPSFIMDRFLPAANAIATTSVDKHPRRPSPRRSSKSKSKRDREAETEAAARARFVTHIRRRALAFEQPKHPPHCQREDAVAHAQAQLPPCAREEAQGEQMTPRACGFMFFVPWSAKPVLLGFQRSPARSRTPPRGDVASVTTASSPPRRSVTLGDVLEKDRKLRDGGLSHWYDEKSGSGKEWANPGWGMALLGTSKRYCADARKALSRLTRSGMDSGDSPRIGTGRERSSSKHKQAASMLRSTLVKMPKLSPPSESWLSNARRSNAGSNKS
ncbi:uncharacterized protein [Miscanthus floridulus]|uniref:uncharacterized protein n=1 Tax=Miscanthus floridulus TaxID=154761 RepID=UPI00345A2B16